MVYEPAASTGSISFERWEKLSPSASAVTTITVSNVSPSGNGIGIMNLGDGCTFDTCVQGASTSLTFDAVNGDNYVVPEALDPFPPASFDDTVNCF